MPDPRKPDDDVDDQTAGQEPQSRENESEENVAPPGREDAKNDALIEDRFEATDN